MTVCEVCGSEDFEKHAGYLYCSICQTQSQEYYEQEYEYQEANTSRRRKVAKTPSKQKKQEVYDDGFWTSFEAFNYIIHGMTEEVKKLGADSNFETLVIKLWAAYLKESKIAFTSRNKEKIPKLGIGFKERDARILYNISLTSNTSKLGCKRKSKSVCSTFLHTSNSSLSSNSKRSLAHKRNKIIDSDYQEQLSMSVFSSSYLADETLESLGKLTGTETSEEFSDSSETLLKSFKEMFTEKDYRLYKKIHYSPAIMTSERNKATENIQCVGKNKLVSILHLALLLSGSEIQLSDLLRFIREGRLSFAKVTHFLPNNIKFPKKDFSYIDVASDNLMPTHLRQRQISGQMARFLKIIAIPTPNMALLLERYCHDLNLPGQIKELSEKILRSCFPATTIPKSKTILPSYEAWAMVSIIFVTKVLFGLNGTTEIFLSRLAQELNGWRRENERRLFVFEDWQKFLECRKTVLMEYHYPTQEQLARNYVGSSKKFLCMLMKESKDDYRNDRIIPYPKYHIHEKLLNSVKRMVRELTKPQDMSDIEFQSSLIPQTSYLRSICRNWSSEAPLPLDILSQDFKSCDVEFALNPSAYLEVLKEKSRGSCSELDLNVGPSLNNSPFQKNLYRYLRLDCSTQYWTFQYPNSESGQLGNFKEEILEKMPENFQWMITECARMLEMNVRDVYDELLRLENWFKSGAFFT